MVVVPSDVLPGRLYSGPAIALALALWAVLGKTAAIVRARISPFPILGATAAVGWITLRRWARDAGRRRLFATSRAAPADFTARKHAGRAASAVRALAPPGLDFEAARDKGWSPREVAPKLTEPNAPPRPGDLFFASGDSVVWTGLGLKIDDPLVPDQRELGSWYLGYVDMDALFAIEWQLAERSDDTSANPFLPLLDCYAAGILPFGLGPDEFVLFALDPGS